MGKPIRLLIYGFSIALSTLAAGLLTFSHYRYFEVKYHPKLNVPTDRLSGLASFRGRLLFITVDDAEINSPGHWTYRFIEPDGTLPPLRGRFGFSHRRFSNGFNITAPWLLFVILPLTPVAALRVYDHRRAKHEAMIGCCRRCGYDLRATPDRCPECGKIPARRLQVPVT